MNIMYCAKDTTMQTLREQIISLFQILIRMRELVIIIIKD